jgi:hypothetical protein
MRDARTKQRMAEEELREAAPMKCFPARAPVQRRAPVPTDRPIELLQTAVVRRKSIVLVASPEFGVEPRGLILDRVVPMLATRQAASGPRRRQK